MNAIAHSRALRIDFLFLDLTTCTRCRGTDAILGSALEAAGGALAAAGTEVVLNKIHVESAAQARQFRFETSPTIRVNGRDIALELRESSCGSEACTDGCGEQIACRVWVHEGREHTVPPVEMIVDAILGAVYAGRAVERPPEPYELPENLERFFAGKEAAPAEGGFLLYAGRAGLVLRAGGQGGVLRRLDGWRMRMPVSTQPAPLAAEAIWHEFHEGLLGFINRRVRSRETAEDILQEVMLRIHRQAAGLQRAEALGAWVHAIAANAIAWTTTEARASAASWLRTKSSVRRLLSSRRPMHPTYAASWLPAYGLC